MTQSSRLEVCGLENSELVKLILLLGSVAGALAAISALIVKIVRVVKKVVKYFKDLKESVDTLLVNDKEQRMEILKLTVMQENMPLSERISAAKKYLKLGGNGDVKAYYEEKLKPYDHIAEGENENETR